MFEKVGVDMPDQVFQEVWQEAERRDSRGEVYIYQQLASIYSPNR